jgi:glycosyltransferase involved in cell wall biosynthesis
MQNNILISIVIPCYNDAQYIEQSVLSALNQTYPNIEVIVVDDGSDIGTKTILRKIEPQIAKLITQENQGQSTARNVGIKEGNGEYILVLDSDDFFESSFCEKAISILLLKNGVKIVSCYTNLLFDDGRLEVFEMMGGDLACFLCKNYALGSSMFRKEDWLSSGGYDESMKQGYEDWEFYIRLLKNGGNAEIIKEPLYTYRKRSNTTTDKANDKKYELLNYIYTKHQNLYKENFELFMKHVLYRMGREEKEKIKNMQRLEFKIGKVILYPIRFIKRLFKK